jgi:choline dehydrogenase-like flavoprotein
MSAAFPAIVGANTTAPVAAMAWRLAWAGRPAAIGLLK